MPSTARTLLLVPAFMGAFLLAVACDDAVGEDEEKAPAPAPVEAPPVVSVHVFNKEGKLVGPIEMPAVRKTAAEWKAQLDEESYKILRNAGTERAGCGDLLDNKRAGVYACKGCKLPLFSSDHKYNSQTGWPSFFQPVARANIEERADHSHGMTRVEILCARCEGHLGHVFSDGPEPTGLRYCLNSASMTFTDRAFVASLADPHLEKKPMPETPATPAPEAHAVFAGGCFWCVEAVFEELKGVKDAVSGYAGDTKEKARYELVAAGLTKHAEAVRITYDPSKITYEELLEVHFATHDPTTLNRQGWDEGAHYRSAIFYANEKEKTAAAAFLKKAQEQFGDKKIVTTLEALGAGFFEAEPKHQDFVCNNPNQRYVRGVAMPKVEKVRKAFKDKVKEEPAHLRNAED